MRRIGVLMSTAVDDPQDPARLAAFAQGLQELGWTIGRNLRIDYRWSASSPDNARKYAAELAALAPDVMLASGTIALAAVQQIGHTTPIVFANLIDPVSGGFVESLARPGGNTTGFLLLHQREMAGAAQRDRAARDAGSGTAGSHPKQRDRTVGRHSVRCLAIGGGVSPGWRARRQRDRARHNRFRARTEWRLDCGGGHASA